MAVVRCPVVAALSLCVILVFGLLEFGICAKTTMVPKHLKKDWMDCVRACVTKGMKLGDPLTCAYYPTIKTRKGFKCCPATGTTDVSGAKCFPLESDVTTPSSAEILDRILDTPEKLFEDFLRLIEMKTNYFLVLSDCKKFCGRFKPSNAYVLQYKFECAAAPWKEPRTFRCCPILEKEHPYYKKILNKCYERSSHHGKSQTGVDPCREVRCENGGTCEPLYEDSSSHPDLIKDEENFRCECTPLYTGKLCDDMRDNLPGNCEEECDNKHGDCNVKLSVDDRLGEFSNLDLADDTWLMIENRFTVSGRPYSDNKFCICKPGYGYFDCSNKCQTGTWGPGCFMKCSKNCEEKKCHRKTGHCKCKKGYAEPRCTELDSDQQSIATIQTALLRVSGEAQLTVPNDQETRRMFASDSDLTSRLCKELGADMFRNAKKRMKKMKGTVEPGVELVRTSLGSLPNLAMACLFRPKTAISKQNPPARRRLRQTPDAAVVQADYNIDFPQQLSQQLDLKMFVQDVVVETSETFESKVVPGIKMDRNSIKVNEAITVRVDNTDDTSIWRRPLAIGLVTGFGVLLLGCIIGVTKQIRGNRSNINKDRNNAYLHSAAHSPRYSPQDNRWVNAAWAGGPRRSQARPFGHPPRSSIRRERNRGQEAGSIVRSPSSRV